MREISPRWRELTTIALAVALAWGLRGQHGHEKGGAVAGAMTGLAMAAVTGGPAWIGAAVIGSLGFAIGGALSYGRFIVPAFHGSWEAIASLALIGFSWGGLGGLGLGLGLALPRYKLWERIAIAGGLLLVWLFVDRLLWGRMSGPEDLKTRELMAVFLLGVWVFLSAYVGVWRRDIASLKLAVAGALGFGLGFPLAAWLQGWGRSTPVHLDWWKTSEHLIGLCGGISLGIAALSLESSWRLPRAVRPWERWSAVAWLLWFLPTWLIANNLDYWISELALFPVAVGKVVWGLLLLLLLGLVVWGWLEMRRGRTFVTSWMPRHLRFLFLAFLWITTGIACSKTFFAGISSPTPVGFLLLALLVTWLIRSSHPKATA